MTRRDREQTGTGQAIGFAKALAELEAGDIRSIYVLMGGEGYLARQFISVARQRLLPEAGQEINYVEARWPASAAERTAAVQRIIDTCRTYPFIPGRRLVVLKDFLPQSREEASWLGAYAKDPSPFTCLAVVAPNGDVRARIGPFEDVPSRQLALVDCELSDAGLARLAEELTLRRGLKIGPAGLKALVESAGGSPWGLETEVEKCSLYFTGDALAARSVDLSSLGEICTSPHWVEVKVFDIIDALLLGREREAPRILEDLLRRGAAPAYVVHMLGGQFRLVLQARLLFEAGRSQQDVVSELCRSGAHRYVAGRCARAARKVSWEDAERCLAVLWQADLRIKGVAGTGWDAAEALEQACFELVAIIGGFHRAPSSLHAR